MFKKTRELELRVIQLEKDIREAFRLLVDANCKGELNALKNAYSDLSKIVTIGKDVEIWKKIKARSDEAIAMIKTLRGVISGIEDKIAEIHVYFDMDNTSPEWQKQIRNRIKEEKRKIKKIKDV